MRFQSARAAFAALLHATSPRAVWMPTYICDSMLQPVLQAGIPVRYYALRPNFHVGEQFGPEEGEILLYVDYFGICASAEAATRERFGGPRLVLDHSQAFFSGPDAACLATIYSPRKFFGLPDGGLICTRAAITLPAETDSASLGRSQHLLLRHAGPATEGYEAFKRAEASLDECTPRRMSRLTSHILSSIDFDGVKARRNFNFEYLHDRLGGTNELKIEFRPVNGPLCYPMLTKASTRERLLRNEIFVPTYWPEVRGRAAPGSFERELAERCLPLPCDQRYTPAMLERVVDVVLGGG